jgi:G3E family GTPase
VTTIGVIGGFLGAGKTSLVREALARVSREQRFSAVTNDQAAGLVDTALLSRSRRTIGEVAGSCFCCDLNALRRECDGLRNEGASVILAEAVGSCTDLVATVLGPLQQGYAGSDLRVAPLTVVADPRRLQRVIFNPRRSSLHSSAAYIYQKQLEEGEVILVNKVDTVSRDEGRSLVDAMQERFPHAHVIGVSAATGEGVHEWLDLVVRREHDSRRSVLDLDYDRYAEGEAVLGWMNATMELEADHDVLWSAWLDQLMAGLTRQLREDAAPIGHVKAIVTAPGGYAVANWVELDEPYSTRGDAGTSRRARLIVNARVQTAPEILEEHVRTSLVHDPTVSVRVEELRAFRPPRPVPTVRLTGAP